MVYKFTFISEESDDFYRVIEADSEATFLDLHKAILKSCGYADDQLRCFYICDEDWEPREQISLADMPSIDSYIEPYLMEEKTLESMLNDEDQKIQYVFDPMGDRRFDGVLKEIITGKNLSEVQVTKKVGAAPSAQMAEEDLSQILATGNNLGDIFDDDDTQGYNDDELDMENSTIWSGEDM